MWHEHPGEIEHLPASVASKIMKKRSLVDEIMGPFDMMAYMLLFGVICWMFTPPKKRK